ncbi:phage regulatory CII family protein [Paucidesulfovibrio longus]|jgi:ABC-type sugar transport system substrate-binding protein|uniref:phage regulatory CII family protein n=1 Tax=Paucidesulfovibrio longus TaxID=889 RepID=UPI0003B5DCFF|nr:phage regulatory CII family protein [Paucidesulfovibrio longus]
MYPKDVTKVVQDTVLGGEMQAKEIAERLGKPYSTLLRELNPFDMRAKLGVETLMEIMRVTRDPRPLAFIAKQLGYRLVPESSSAERAVKIFRPGASV